MGGTASAPEAIVRSSLSEAQHRAPESPAGAFGERRVSVTSAPPVSLSESVRQTAQGDSEATGEHRGVRSRNARRALDRPASPPPPKRSLAAEPGQAEGSGRSSIPVPRIGDPVPPKPAGFDWYSVFTELKAQQELAQKRGDECALRAYRSAIRAISTELTKAYLSLHPAPYDSKAFEPEAAYTALIRLRDRIRTDARTSASAPGRAFGIGIVLGDIDRLTHAKHFELDLRNREFAACAGADATHDGPAVVRDMAILWERLWHEFLSTDSESEQAFERNDEAATEDASLVTEYFADLVGSHIGLDDPWSASRATIREEVDAGRTSQALLLEAAHRKLLRVMCCP